MLPLVVVVITLSHLPMRVTLVDALLAEISLDSPIRLHGRGDVRFGTDYSECYRDVLFSYNLLDRLFLPALMCNIDKHGKNGLSHAGLVSNCSVE